MEIKIHTTVEDLIEFSMYCYEHSPVMRRQLWVNILTIPILVAIAGVVIFAGTQEIKYAIVCWLASVISGILNYMTFGNTMRKKLRKIYEEKPMDASVGERLLRIDENAIVEKSSTSENRIDWSGVKDIYVDDQYAYIIIGSLQGHILPRGGVLEGNFDEFMERANDYWAKSVGDESG